MPLRRLRQHRRRDPRRWPDEAVRPTSRPSTPPRRWRAVAGSPERGVPRGRHQPGRPPQARRRHPRRARRRQPAAARRGRGASTDGGLRIGAGGPQQRPGRPPARPPGATRCSRRRCWPAPRGRSATSRRPAATCCSAPGASTSRTSPRPATSASPAPAARRCEGFHRNRAVLGASEHCVATHPSDMAVALAALDASSWCSAGRRAARPDGRPPPAARRRARSATPRWRTASWSPRSSCRRCPTRAGRPTARCATGRRTPSPWCPSPRPSTWRTAPSATSGSRWAGSRTSPGGRASPRGCCAGGRPPRTAFRAAAEAELAAAATAAAATRSRCRWPATRSPVAPCADLAGGRPMTHRRASRVRRHAAGPPRRARPRSSAWRRTPSSRSRQDPRLRCTRVQATVARGRVTGVDVSAAEALDGRAAGADPPQRAAARRHRATGSYAVLQSPDVAFRGQLVGAVVAETPEIARHGADAGPGRLRRARRTTPSCARTTRTSTSPTRSTRPTRPTPTRATSTRALAAAAVAVDQTLHDADGAQQPDGAARHARAVGGRRRLTALRLHPGRARRADHAGAGCSASTPEDVRVVSPYVGGGFGSKGMPHAHNVLVVLAAQSCPAAR